jgi:hypothetical protein
VNVTAFGGNHGGRKRDRDDDEGEEHPSGRTSAPELDEILVEHRGVTVAGQELDAVGSFHPTS